MRRRSVVGSAARITTCVNKLHRLPHSCLWSVLSIYPWPLRLKEVPGYLLFNGWIIRGMCYHQKPQASACHTGLVSCHCLICVSSTRASVLTQQALADFIGVGRCRGWNYVRRSRHTCKTLAPLSKKMASSLTFEEVSLGLKRRIKY
jgi:hypothetical protein